MFHSITFFTADLAMEIFCRYLLAYFLVIVCFIVIYYMYRSLLLLYRNLRCAWPLAANIWDYTRTGNSGEMTSCSHKLRLYWHRLWRPCWRLGVTDWGSGDVFQSLSEAQIQATSCSHYLRLCLYRLLRLGWSLAVTSWGYAYIGCSGSGDVLQSLSDAMLCISYSG